MPFGGVRLGLNLMSRQFSNPLLPAQVYSTVSPGLVAGLKFRFTRSVSLLGRARVHYLHYDIDETKSLGYAELGLMLNY